MSAKTLLPISTLLCLSAAVALAAAAKTMSVQVRKAEIRDTPNFLGKVVASLNYGDKVAVAEQNGPWTKVSSAGNSGWVHNSALTTKTIVLQSGSAAETTASSGELALAGKGFNADVESQFKANHKDVDFKWVDRMEKIVIPPRRIQAFAEEGGLVSGDKGGAR